MGRKTRRAAPREPSKNASPGGLRRDQALVVLAVVAVTLLGTAWGVSLARQQPESLASASVAAVDPEWESVEDYLDGLREQTPLPPGVQMVRDLSQVAPGPLERLEVAYFHRTRRCTGCVVAEELIRATLYTHYADRLESGEMVLRVEDVQKPADPQLVRTYDAYGSSLYLGVVKAGRTHVLPVEDIWYVLGDEARFEDVLRAKIDAALALP